MYWQLYFPILSLEPCSVIESTAFLIECLGCGFSLLQIELIGVIQSWTEFVRCIWTLNPNPAANTILFPIDESTGKVAAQGSSIVPAGHSGEAQTQDPVIQSLAPLTLSYPLPCGLSQGRS